MASTQTQVRAFGRIHWLAGVPSFSHQDGGFADAIVPDVPGHCFVALAPGNVGAEASTRVAIGGMRPQTPADSVTFSARLDQVTGLVEVAILEVEAAPSVYTDRDFWLEVTSYFSPSLQT